MTPVIDRTIITTVDQLETYIEQARWLGTKDANTLREFLPNLTVKDDALFTLDGQLVPDARLVEQQGFHYPYDPVQVWRIGAKGEKPTWVTAFPKRKSTMTKKGYVEGTVTYKVSLFVEIPLAGEMVVLVNRLGDPVSIVPDRWEAGEA